MTAKLHKLPTPKARAKPQPKSRAAKAAQEPVLPGGSKDRITIIYDALRQAIIEKAVAPGAKLPEDTIAHSFGVSRTIVQHALRRLAIEGLVEMRRNRGAIVARPSWEEARDLFDLRLAVERMVMERVTGHLKPEDLAELRAHADEEAAAQGANESRSIRLATEFHIRLAEMTGSPVLSRYVNEIAWRCGLMLTLYSRPHSSECGVNEHFELIAAIEAGDSAKAVALMDAHLGGVISRAAIDRAEPALDLGDVLKRYQS